MKTIKKLSVINRIYDGWAAENNSTIVYIDDEYLGTYFLSDVNLLKDFASKLGVEIKEFEYDQPVD